MKPSAVLTSNETIQTVSSFNAHSLKAAIFETLALKIGKEINNGTIAPSTRRAFFKFLHNIFLSYSKNIPFEQFNRIHKSGPLIAICETNSSNVFVIDRTSFEQKNFYFLHAVQEAMNAFISVLMDFGLEPYDPKKKHSIQPPSSHHSNHYQPSFP